jgi:hypothetical protein
VLVIRPKLGVELNFEKLIKFLIMNYQIDWIILTYNLRSNPILVFEMFESSTLCGSTKCRTRWPTQKLIISIV